MAPVDKTPRHTRYEEGRKEKKAEESGSPWAEEAERKAETRREAPGT